MPVRGERCIVSIKQAITDEAEEANVSKAARSSLAMTFPSEPEPAATPTTYGVEEPATLLHTLQRGLMVLEAVAAADGTATAKALGRQLDLKIGTCYHLLRTLVAAGYLVRLPGGRYDVGPRAASLSRNVQRRSGPAPELKLILTRLHNRTKEACYLLGWRHGIPVLQEYLSGLQTVSVPRLDVGFAGLMHARASCKAVLAWLPEDQVKAMFDGVDLIALTERTIVDYDALAVELSTVRRRGLALDIEEYASGVCCVAAAFLDCDGKPAGAFTVSVPSERFEQHRARLTTDVREAASLATGLLRTGKLVLPGSAPDAAA